MLESLQERIDELEAKLKGQTPKEQVATLRRRLSVEGARIQELLVSEASEDSSENMAAAQNIQAAFDKDTPITPEKKGQMGQIYSELETVYASPEKKESAAEAGRRAGYMGAEYGKLGAEAGRSAGHLGGKYGQNGGRPLKRDRETEEDEEPSAKRDGNLEKLLAELQPSRSEPKAAAVKKFHDFCRGELVKAGLEKTNMTNEFMAKTIRLDIN